MPQYMSLTRTYFVAPVDFRSIAVNRPGFDAAFAPKPTDLLPVSWPAGDVRFLPF